MATSYGTVNERSGGATFTITPKDADGDPVVPSTARYRIDDVKSGEAVRETESLSPSSSIEIVLTKDDTTIVNEAEPYELRVITVTLDAGLDAERNEELYFRVRNLRFATTEE